MRIANITPKRKTAFIFDEQYMWHNTSGGALFMPAGGYIQNYGMAESPESKRRFKNLLEVTGLYDVLVKIKPEYATEAQLEFFHTKEHIANVKRISDSGNMEDTGHFAVAGKDSYEIAKLAVGGAIMAVKAVVNGEVDNAYVLCRPPGHHAEKGCGMGYCIFNNAVIAARYAQKELGLKKVMVLDWDVHHGNGIEDAFKDDDSVLFISLHQENLFPVGRGFMDHQGSTPESTINIPLPITGDAGYLYALDQIVRPAAKRFKPELIIVASGLDANLFDPLARMYVTAEGFGKMAAHVRETAEDVCGGKMVCTHEGGYSPEYVPFGGHAIVDALAGTGLETIDPFKGALGVLEEMQPHVKEAIDKIKAFNKL